jgi:hypothetical protein
MERGQICGLLLWLLPVLCSILTDLEDKSTHSPTAWRISPNILPRKGVGELKAHEPIICAHRRSGLQPAGRSDALKAPTPTHAAGDGLGMHVAGLTTAQTTHPRARFRRNPTVINGQIVANQAPQQTRNQGRVSSEITPAASFGMWMRVNGNVDMPPNAKQV